MKHPPQIYRVTGGLLVAEEGDSPILEGPDQYVQNLYFLQDKFQILGSTRQLEWDFKRWAPKCDEHARTLSLVYFDIDHFKRFNDDYGETLVDEYILKPYQQLIDKIVRHNGFAYAEGGDELVLLLPNHELDEAGYFADYLRRKTKQASFEITGKEEHFTVSLGVAEREPSESLQDLKSRANVAKRLAKRNGRNQVCLVRGKRPH